MPTLLGLGCHPPSGRPKTLSFCLFVTGSIARATRRYLSYPEADFVAKNVESFVCLSVRHTFERQSLCARFRHEGVGVQKRF